MPAANNSVTALTDVSGILKTAVEKKVFDGEGLYETPVAQFYDMDLLDDHMAYLKESFGPTVTHHIAIKSNSVTKMLRHAYEKHGFGIEAASIGEVQHAVLHCGIPKNMVVFDSPCKTKAELEYSIREKIHCNLDNFEEFERAKVVVEKIKAENAGNGGNGGKPSLGLIGFRINPLVGAGEIEALSVSTADSKFGTPISERVRILQCYAENEWLNTIHVHVGSGGMGVSILTTGIKTVVGLAGEINKARGSQQILTVDMGGGLPANYKSDEWGGDKVPTYGEYAAHLKKEVPDLFNGKYKVVTEFGQSLHAKSGFIASRVEWTKGTPEKPILITHIGGDSCVRQVYNGDHFRRIEGYKSDGSAFDASHPKRKHNIAGPLCFQGDFIGKDRDLPEGITSGDIVVLKDAGANTFSIFSRHCSRLCPPVYGVRDNGATLYELKERESMESVSQFWGAL